jgi:putative membrane protein
MITRLIISTLAVLITAFTLDGVTVDPWWWAVIIAIVLGFINAWIRPLVKLLALPINMLTLGLFTFVINALMVMLCSALSLFLMVVLVFCLYLVKSQV